MPRIIAGTAGGKPLRVPAVGTRPTSDMAREGLFNSLATMLDLTGTSVLDLFAGSGAVGLEALSRGAAHATLVDQSRDALSVLRANIRTTGLTGAMVVGQPVQTFLALAASQFQLVFADPPYALQTADVHSLLTALRARGWLAKSAVVVVERSARDDDLVWPGGIRHIRQKRYGEAVLWYGQAD